MDGLLKYDLLEKKLHLRYLAACGRQMLVKKGTSCSCGFWPEGNGTQSLAWSRLHQVLGSGVSGKLIHVDPLYGSCVPCLQH